MFTLWPREEGVNNLLRHTLPYLAVWCYLLVQPRNLLLLMMSITRSGAFKFFPPRDVNDLVHYWSNKWCNTRGFLFLYITVMKKFHKTPAKWSPLTEGMLVTFNFLLTNLSLACFLFPSPVVQVSVFLCCFNRLKAKIFTLARKAPAKDGQQVPLDGCQGTKSRLNRNSFPWTFLWYLIKFRLSRRKF